MSRIGCPPTHTKLVRFYPLHIAAARTHACIRLCDPPALVSLFLFIVRLFFHLPVFSFLSQPYYVGLAPIFFIFDLSAFYFLRRVFFFFLLALLISFPRSLFSFESFSSIIFCCWYFRVQFREQNKQVKKAECKKYREEKSKMKYK